MNNNLSSFRNFGIPRLGFSLLCACLLALLASPAGGQSIDPNKWGEVTAPVYGTSDKAPMRALNCSRAQTSSAPIRERLCFQQRRATWSLLQRLWCAGAY